MVRKSFRFGEWQVDPNLNVVSNGDLRRQLEPRAMDVLLHLCQQQPLVVSAEELLAACWGSTLFGDNPVHKVIAQLRRAFDDSSVAPRYIETIRKRGYRTLAEIVYEDEAATGSWLHDSPFRGLEAFEEQHASIFFGRKRATDLLLETLLAQARAGCAMVLVLGPSGSGKTSLIRAGLVPQLTAASAGLAPGMAVACSLHFDCADLGGGELFQALGSVLLDSESDGILLFDKESAESLGRRLAHDMESLVPDLRRQLPGTRLAIVIDRFEAIFRLPQISEEGRASFIAALDQLARSGCVLLILACRNDFYPHLAAYPALMDLKLRGGHFDLNRPSGAELAQIIRQPARAAELQFEVDEASGARLDDVLYEAARTSPDTLPLLQYCLQELYRLRSQTGQLSHAALRELGGLEGAVGARAEQVVAGLGEAQVAALPRVLSRVVSVSEDEMAVTSRRAAWSALRDGAERELVKALVDARLFVTDLHGGTPAFGVAHEALLRRWPRVLAWTASHRDALQLRARIGLQAARWHAHARQRDLLLPRGTQSNQAKGLLKVAEFSLSAREREFILASLRKVKVGERLRLSVLGAVLGLAVLASGLGLTARAAQAQAERHRTEAEGLMGYMLGEFVDKVRPLGRLDLLDSISSRALGYLADPDNTAATAVALTQRAKALQVIAEVNIARGDTAAAKVALVVAQDISQRQLKAAPDDVTVLKNLGGNAFWLGQIHLDQKDWARAEQYFTQYREFSDRLAAADPTSVDGWIEQSYAHNSLGSLALKQSQIHRAADEFSLSVTLKTRALAQAPADQSLAADLADSLSWLASTREKLGDLDTAMLLYEREFQLVRGLYDAAPGDALWGNRLSLAFAHQADLNLARGRPEAAIAGYLQAQALLRAIIGQDPSNRNWQLDLCSVQLMLLTAQADSADAQETLRSLRQLHDKLTALSVLEPKNLSLLRLIALTQHRVALMQLKMSHFGDARRSLAPALDTLSRIHAKAPSDQAIREALAESLLLQADIDSSGGDVEAARELCRKARAVLRPVALGSSDFHLLAPWVRAHSCTDNDAIVARELNQLYEMKYREAGYLRFVSAHITKKDIK